MLCECCGEETATHWMEWGEWLCDECFDQAIEESESNEAQPQG
jgi:hypothetical protein